MNTGKGGASVGAGGSAVCVDEVRKGYEHPVDRFVASFIGETNTLEADLHSVSGTTGWVRFASGARFPASLPRSGMTSGKVQVVIRPEHVGLVPDRSVATLLGRIEGAVYLRTDFGIQPWGGF